MPDVRFIGQSFEVKDFPDDMVDRIADSARNCYDSYDRSSPESDEALVGNLRDMGHMSPFELGGQVRVAIVTDRAIANELVRHRHLSYAQTSTRYVNSSSKGFEFILPPGLDGRSDAIMRAACRHAAEQYDTLVGHGLTPQVARSVLPLCTATRIVVAGNPRAWLEMLGQRTSPAAHPMMRELMQSVRDDFSERCPVVFGE
jgi:thymidylate synthase (FAD)